MNDDYPLYSTIDLQIGDRDVDLTIMYRGKRFDIQLTAKDLHRQQSDTVPSSLEQQFQHFRDTLDHEPGAMEAFEKWMVEPCLPYIWELAP